MADFSALTTPPLEGPRTDGQTRSAWRELFCVAAFIVLALIYNVVAWARGEVTSWLFLLADYLTAGAAIALAFLASRRVEQALFILPVTAVLMTAPNLAHLPFLREFGSFAAVGVALRLATQDSISFRTIPRRVADVVGAHTTALFVLYVLITVVPMALLLWHGRLFEAKVVATEMIYECIAISIVASIAVVVSHSSTVALKTMFEGMSVTALMIIIVSIAALFLPFSHNETLSQVDYFGLYYYCRLRLTAFGPDQYCALLVLVTPALLLMRSFERESFRGKVATLALYILPILLVAGNSRSARVGLIVTEVIALAIPRFRRAVIGPTVFAVPFFVLTMNYRCISDYFLASSGGPLQGGYIASQSFFSDPARLNLIDTVIRQTMAESKIYLIFGHGAGLAAFDQFGLGGHSTILDLFVDKGAAGYMMIVAIILIAMWRIFSSWTRLSGDLRLYTYTALLMLTPLVTSGITYDARRWLFTWMIIGILLGIASLAISNAKPSTERLAEAA
jgi:hypothetical protein